MSKLGDVYLMDAEEVTAGHFKCEVSADSPSFQTIREQRYLTVLSKYTVKPSYNVSRIKCFSRYPYAAL